MTDRHIGLGFVVAEAVKRGYVQPWKQPTSLPAPVTDTEGFTTMAARVEPVMNTLNDASNAARLLAAFGKHVRFDASSGLWCTWRDGRWHSDLHGTMSSAASAVLRGIFNEARKAEDAELAKRLATWASKSLNKTHIEAAITLFRGLPGVTFLPSETDADPLAIQTCDGTRINLRDGSARPSIDDDLMLKAAGCDYDAEADCRIWEASLAQIFEDDAEIIAFVQRLFGYFLTGDMREQVFVYFYGHGANGKSLVLNVLRDVLGDYAMQIPAEAYMATKYASNADGATPTLTRMVGKRLVISNETREGAHFNEGLLKQMTGGDRITARPLYRDSFEFSPVAKHLMAGNHRPIITGDDHGIWRRMLLVPFRRQFRDDEQDKSLPEKLRGEYPGILNWLIRGAREWQRIGLSPPASISAETAAYRTDMDTLGQWLDECTQQAEGSTTRARDAYQQFSFWCRGGGYTPVSEKRFADRMATRGFQKSRTNKGVVYVGLQLP